jgi:hypothetical protein
VRDKEDCAAEGEAWQRLVRVEVVSSGRWSGRSVGERIETTGKRRITESACVDGCDRERVVMA